MKESIFQYDIKSSLIAVGADAFKIPDSIRSKGMRFIPVKPSDIHAVYHGMPILIECKQIKEKEKGIFKFDKFQSAKEKKEKIDILKTNQIMSLIKYKQARGMSYVFINDRRKGINKAYIFCINDMIREINKGEKSIDLNNKNNYIDHIRGSRMYDIELFLKIEYGKWLKYI